MTPNKLNPELKKLCEALDSLAQTILGGTTDNRTLLEMYGWNCPALNRHSLARVASGLAKDLRDREIGILDEPLPSRVKEAASSIERLEGGSTIGQIWGGNAASAVSAYMSTLQTIRYDLEPLFAWSSIKDSNLLPPKLMRRIRSYEAIMDEITPKREQLLENIRVITDATDAAESLPTDLAALAAARSKIDDLQKKSELMHDEISVKLKDSNGSVKVLQELQEEANKLVAQCEEAYRITTSKGLAGAFDQRARSLAYSMWVWVCGLIAALTIGYFMGSNRLKDLTDLLNSADKQHEIVWPTAILAVISLGAPLWLAWIATKQIGQRFRLAEDYAFKASVAKAYEGYRKEAAKIDKSFEARLFSSALARLEEAPLRLVEGQTHGSPWHEFFESESFREALNKIPGFDDRFKRAQKKAGDNVNIPGKPEPKKPAES